MPKKNIPDDKANLGKGDGAASRVNKTKAIKHERKQVVQEYIDSLRNFAKSMWRKLN